MGTLATTKPPTACINYMLYVLVIPLVFDCPVHIDVVGEMVRMTCSHFSAAPLNKWFKSPSPGIPVSRAV